MKARYPIWYTTKDIPLGTYRLQANPDDERDGPDDGLLIVWPVPEFDGMELCFHDNDERHRYGNQGPLASLDPHNELHAHYNEPHPIFDGCCVDLVAKYEKTDQGYWLRISLPTPAAVWVAEIDVPVGNYPDKHGGFCRRRA